MGNWLYFGPSSSGVDSFLYIGYLKDEVATEMKSTYIKAFYILHIYTE